MFQNITDKIEHDEEDVKLNTKRISKETIKELFFIQNIILYVISCMVSMVSFNGEIAPFGLAIFAAVCSNRIAARSSIYFLFNWYINKFWCKWSAIIYFNYTNIYSCNINF